MAGLRALLGADSARFLPARFCALPTKLSGAPRGE